jgi:hypothetical protein
MINEAKRKEILSTFSAKVEANAEAIRNQFRLQEYFVAGGFDTVKESVKDIQKMVVRNLPEDIAVEEASMRFAITGNVINITLGNKRSDAATAFKYKIPVVVRPNSTNASLYDEVVTGIFGVYEALLNLALVEENVAKVNEVLAELVEMAGLDYVVRVIPSFGQGSKKIAYLSDDEIVFVADDSNIFNLDTVAVAMDPNPYFSEESIAGAKKAMAEVFATAQTTAQFAESKGFALLTYLCDISKLKKAASYVKKISNKNIKNQSMKNDCIAYYLDGDIFGLAEIKDGKAEVILSPIDLSTFRRVEGVDILA